MAKLTLRDGITKGYFYTETIADGVTGATLPIPPMGLGRFSLSCTVVAGANTGKFQVTTSSDAAVAAASATWQDWTEGDSTGTVSDTLIGPVTGIRGVSVSGEITIEIVV